MRSVSTALTRLSFLLGSQECVDVPRNPPLLCVCLHSLGFSQAGPTCPLCLFACLQLYLHKHAFLTWALGGGVAVLVSGTSWLLNPVPEGSLGVFRIFVSLQNSRLGAAVLVRGRLFRRKNGCLGLEGPDCPRARFLVASPCFAPQPPQNHLYLYLSLGECL